MWVWVWGGGGGTRCCVVRMCDGWTSDRAPMRPNCVPPRDHQSGGPRASAGRSGVWVWATTAPLQLGHVRPGEAMCTTTTCIASIPIVARPGWHHQPMIGANPGSAHAAAVNGDGW